MGIVRYRRFVFWVFTASFFVVAATLIFYAFGYRYSTERGIFIYSGSITVKSLPQTVGIAVDGNTLATKQYGILNNTIHIPGLMPGEHTLAISAPGYGMWSKKVSIQSGISSEYWNVILTRTDYPGVTLPNTKGTIRIYPSTDTNLLALVKEESGVASVVIYNRTTQTGREVFSRDAATFDFMTLENFEWSPDGEHILLPLIEHGSRSYFIVNVADNTTEKLTDITPGLMPSRARWNTTGNGELLFLSDGSLYRFDTIRERIPALLAEHVLAYDISSSAIYVAAEETGVVSRFRNTGSSESQTEITPAAGLDLGRGASILDVYDEERIVLLEQHGMRRLFVRNRSPEKDYGFPPIATNITNFQFSNDGKKLLFTNENEVGVYFTRVWDVQPRRDENEISQIARFSDSIKNVAWSEDYEHVLFTRGSTLKIIELDGRGGRAINDIKAFTEAPSQILSLFSENQLFIVIPNHDIDSIVFPEPQGLFGQ